MKNTLQTPLSYYFNVSDFALRMTLTRFDELDNTHRFPYVQTDLIEQSSFTDMVRWEDGVYMGSDLTVVCKEILSN